MPDAINHLASYNRIALALENMHPTDMTALAEAITALANKPAAPITVAPANPTITVAPANPTITVAPANPTITVSPANPTITVNAGGTGSSSDCGQDICDLIAKIDQLICVNAAMTAAIIQQSKADIYWSTDGPNLGIDAPPGSFIFPTPGDSSPPSTTTPWPDSGNYTNPITGEFISPPIVNGIQFFAPPGGMQGSENKSVYDTYKCKMAYIIIGTVRYSYDWFGWLASWSSIFAAFSLPVMIKFLNWVASIKSGITYAGAWFDGVQMPSYTSTVLDEWLGDRVAIAINRLIWLDTVFINAIAVIVIDLLALAAIFYTATTQMVALLDAKKDEFACALYKAKSVGEARDNFLNLIDKYSNTLLEQVLGADGNGHIKIISHLLTDALLTTLFACPEGIDSPETLPSSGSCLSCILCADMDVTLPINQTSTANWVNLSTQDRVGLVQYPISYPITLHGVLKLCAVVTAVTGAGANFTLKLFKNGSLVGSGWIHAGEGEEQEIGINCGQVSYWDKTPVPFEGNYTVTLECAGSASNRPTFTWHTLSYKDNVP
jgi:hypothetical protein